MTMIISGGGEGEPHLVVDDRHPGCGVTDVAAGAGLGSVLVSEAEVQTLHHSGESEGGESSGQHLAHIPPGADLVVAGCGGVELVAQLPVRPPEDGGDWPGLQEADLALLRHTELQVQGGIDFSADKTKYKSDFPAV